MLPDHLPGELSYLISLTTYYVGAKPKKKLNVVQLVAPHNVCIFEYLSPLWLRYFIISQSHLFDGVRRLYGMKRPLLIIYRRL